MAWASIVINAFFDDDIAPNYNLGRIGLGHRTNYINVPSTGLEYTYNINNPQWGTIDGSSGSTYLTVEPSARCKIKNVTYPAGKATIETSSNDWLIRLICENSYSFLTVIFTQKPTTTVSAGEGGSVTITSNDGENEQVNATTIRRYSNSNCTITASPNTGYRFLRWSDGGTESPRTVAPGGSYTAVFQRYYNMTVSVSGPGSVNGHTSSWTEFYTGAASLLAAPGAHAYFEGWFNRTGTKVSESLSYTLAAADNAWVEARFAQYARITSTFRMEAEGSSTTRLEGCKFSVGGIQYSAGQTASVTSWEDETGTIPVNAAVAASSASANVVAPPSEIPLFQILGWYEDDGEGGLTVKSASASWGAPRSGDFVARVRLQNLSIKVRARQDGSVGETSAALCRVDVMRNSVLLARVGLDDPVTGLFARTDRLALRCYASGKAVVKGVYSSVVAGGASPDVPLGAVSGTGVDSETGEAFTEYTVDADTLLAIFNAPEVEIAIVFTNAEPMRVSISTSNESGLSANNAVALSSPATEAGEGYYYAGAQTVTAFPAPGWEATRWNVVLDAVTDETTGDVTIPAETVVDLRKRRLPDGSGQTMEDPGFSTESCSFVLTRPATILVEFSRVRHRVSWSVDAASVSGNRRRVTLEWKDVGEGDYHGNRQGETWVQHNETNTAGYADVPSGANVRLTPTDEDDTDQSIETVDDRFAGFSFRGWFLEDGSAAYSRERNPLVMTVRANASLVAKFGAKIYVYSSTGGSSLSDPVVSVSANPDEEGEDSLDFTYGDPVFLHAPTAEDVNAGYGDVTVYFHGWKEENTPQAATLPATSVSDTVARFVPEEQRQYIVWAMYDTDPPVRHIRLTNDGAEFGRLSIEAAASSAGGVTVEPETQEQFNAYLQEAYPAATRAGARLLAASSGAAVAEGPEDVFAKVTGVGPVIISCIPLTQESLFSGWTAAGYQPGPRAETPVAFSSHSTEQFTPLRDMLIVANYSAEEENSLFVRFAVGSSSAQGVISVSPARSAFRRGETAHVSASPISGYKFAGWFDTMNADGTTIQTKASFDYTFTSSGTERVIYAKFEPDAEAVYEWEGGRTNKQLTWRSKRYKAAGPFNPSSARVYADGYPVSMTVDLASSPDEPAGGSGRRAQIALSSQDGRRLPRLRPEKNMEVEVSATEAVTQIDVSTSMLGMRNGAQ